MSKGPWEENSMWTPDLQDSELAHNEIGGAKVCPCCGYPDDGNQVYCACDCYICEGLTKKICLNRPTTTVSN